MKLKMLPDKIYVREYPDGIARFWESKKKEDVVATIPHEYIRKEALLEWVEGQLETLKPLLDTDPYKEAYIGKCEAFKEVINKLNEM